METSVVTTQKDHPDMSSLITEVHLGGFMLAFLTQSDDQIVGRATGGARFMRDGKVIPDVTSFPKGTRVKVKKVN